MIEVKEFTLEEKRNCIASLISFISGPYCSYKFICNSFELQMDCTANFMSVVFPELYNGLKDLAFNDPTCTKYNSNDNRVREKHNPKLGFFAIWKSEEVKDRIDFLTDLNNDLINQNQNGKDS